MFWNPSPILRLYCPLSRLTSRSHEHHERDPFTLFFCQAIEVKSNTDQGHNALGIHCDGLCHKPCLKRSTLWESEPPLHTTRGVKNTTQTASQQWPCLPATTECTVTWSIITKLKCFIFRELWATSSFKCHFRVEDLYSEPEHCLCVQGKCVFAATVYLLKGAG